LLAIILAVALGGCSSETLPTNKQAAMAQMTFSPEKCEEIGATMKQCDGAHS
jgi:predicted lipoprotein